MILASGSPRRAELLRRAGFEFEVMVPERPEPRYEDGDPSAYALGVAEYKAEEVAERAGPAIVVTADTIVVIDGEVLGKPGSRSDAERMLRLLSGRTHAVTTAVCVVDVAGARSLSAADTTRLTLRELSVAELAAYLDTPEPMDKAGAYALQGAAAEWVTRIEGDRETVIGLPTAVVRRLLSRLGSG
ncbi:MAG TPA: Maf family protein [Candidatus Dormibacteraeota bacterium]